MKKCILTVLTILLAATLSAETRKTITIQNSLNETVYYLYLSPVDEREWGDDLLGDDLLEEGGSFEAEYPVEEGKLYDLMAEVESEKAYRIEDIDLSAVDTIAIGEEDFLPFGGHDPVFRDISFSNETEEDIYYLYISSRDSNYWGEDLLGDDILSAGDSIVLNLPIDSEYPDNDIMAEGESGSSYQIMDENMMEVDSFTIREEDLVYSGDEYDDSDDYDYDEDASTDSYTQGYRDGFRDAWKEAYGQGFQDALEQ